MVWSLAFDPLVPLWALISGIVIAVLLSGLSGFLSLRGWALRSLTMALLLLALANPAIEREDREPLSSVVALVVDKSQSQRLARLRCARSRGGGIRFEDRGGLLRLVFGLEGEEKDHPRHAHGQAQAGQKPGPDGSKAHVSLLVPLG